ncbi:MAG: vitamin K epoxide reductase family protein, partial [Chthoniobacterales bacterium]
TVRRGWLQPSLYTLAAVIALVGLGDSIYLTAQHLTGQGVDCFATTGCETVLTSRYAEVGKVPLAGFGAAAYFTVFSLATLSAFGRAWPRPFFVCLVGSMLAVTCWLFYLQAFVLHAFCEYCLLSATLVGLLTIIAIATKRRA